MRGRDPWSWLYPSTKRSIRRALNSSLAAVVIAARLVLVAGLAILLHSIVDLVFGTFGLAESLKPIASNVASVYPVVFGAGVIVRGILDVIQITFESDEPPRRTGTRRPR